MDKSSVNPSGLEGIAIVGMAGRFPGAPSVSALWALLREGREGIRRLEEQELLGAGVSAALLRMPNYVRATAAIEGYDCFDADYFGYSPREAALIDPQHRTFLEEGIAALEDAGHDWKRSKARVGVFAGANMSSYLLENLHLEGNVSMLVRQVEVFTGNDKDYVPTRLSYKLGLTGPSISVSSACSTSLVAAVMGCQQLADFHCDVAVAGGVAVAVPHEVGYLFEDLNGGLSPDGHCRPFDEHAEGCVFGSGVGVVVLKRLEDALSDGDHVYAVIRGWAINNDGATKAGFMAPGVDGQAEVIAEAQCAAGFDPRSIGYVETHGTATALGDAIEIAALKRVFGDAPREGRCALGAVKSNVGHLVAAAGVTGLIKTALALRHEEIPPTLHFRRPNPRLGLEQSPFFVPSQLTPWPASDAPRRAGVSAFGVGGTNAHVCLEQAAAAPTRAPARPMELIVLSAHSPDALESLSGRMAAHFRAAPVEDLSDVAWTLQTGRIERRHRRCLVAPSLADAGARLLEPGPGRVFTGSAGDTPRRVVALFSGAGSIRPEAVAALYRSEPAFRAALDQCAEILRDEAGIDVAALLGERADRGSGHPDGPETAASGLPLLVAIEYSLLQLWARWGVRPETCVGYSTGEYLAAYWAGVFDLESLLRVTVGRGRLLDEVAGYAMLLVQLGEQEIQELLGHDLSVAAVNSPRQCLLSGPRERLVDLELALRQAGVACLWSPIAGAPHSSAVARLLPRFRTLLAGIRLRVAQRPYLSTVTGSWVSDKTPAEPDFWCAHLRNPVRFEQAIAPLMAGEGRAFLELGAGDQLCSMVRMQPGFGSAHIAQASLRQKSGKASDEAFLMEALGRLWISGVDVDWLGVRPGARTRKVSLPTYPFKRARHWAARVADPSPSPVYDGVAAGLAGCLYVPRWEPSPRAAPPAETLADDPASPRWWIVAGDVGLTLALVRRVVAMGRNVLVIRPGAELQQTDANEWTVRFDSGEDWERLVAELGRQSLLPDQIADLRLAGVGIDDFTPLRELLAMLPALGRGLGSRTRLCIVASYTSDLAMDGDVAPGTAMVASVVKVINREMPHLRSQIIDVRVPPSASPDEALLVGRLVDEMRSPETSAVVAFRGPQRWEQRYRPGPSRPAEGASPYRPNGAYFITGGLGQIGLSVAEDLAHRFQARLTLVSRSRLPSRSEWSEFLATHPEHDDVACRIRRLLHIESCGATLHLVSADVADRRAIAAAVQAAHDRYGSIDGVFHFAGAIERRSFELISDLTEETLEANFRAKVNGTIALADALRALPPCWCVLASSIASVYGGLGNAAYAAANRFMDDFARRQRATTGRHWVSVNWTYWSHAQRHDRQDDLAHRRALGMLFRDQGITTEQGLALIEHILACPAEPQWVISLEPPEAKLAELMRERASPNRVALSARGALQTEFVAPRRPIERDIATVWEDVIGVRPIGLHDSFFELGGDSITAVRLAQALRERLGLQMQLRQLVGDPTVAGTVSAIESNASQEAGEPARLVPLRDAVAQRAVASRSLVCVPYAGGNGIMYAAMAAALPPHYAVFALDVLGSDYGDAQSDAHDTEALARMCVDEIGRLAGGPLEIYGHCGGSVLALEIARQLEAGGRPVAAVYAGAVVPFSSDGSDEIDYMQQMQGVSDSQLQALLKQLGGIDENLDPEAARFIVASFRRDAIAAFAYYRQLRDREGWAKLVAPLYCIVGDDDPLVNGFRTRVAHWKQFAQTVNLAVIQGGGHYFVRHLPRQVAGLIADHELFEAC